VSLGCLARGDDHVNVLGRQSVSVAAAVYNRAREQGLGTEIPTDWFLQDVRD
jgi:alanine dehydrogenase